MSRFLVIEIFNVKVRSGYTFYYSGSSTSSSLSTTFIASIIPPTSTSSTRSTRGTSIATASRLRVIVAREMSRRFVSNATPKFVIFLNTLRMRNDIYLSKEHVGLVVKDCSNIGLKT